MTRTFELAELLSAPSQEAVRALIKQLCENEGISVPLEGAAGLQILEEGIPLWEAWMVPQYALGTRRLYAYYVGHVLSEDPAPTSLSIQQRQAAQLLNGKSPTAVKNELKALKSFFGYLHKEGLWPNDPARDIGPPVVPKRKVKAPSMGEVSQLFAVVDTTRLKVMLVLFSNTGIRFSELSGLRWERVDFDNREITVIGKGNKERTIPMSPIAYAILQDVKGDAQPEDLVFPSQSIEGWDNRDANRSLARLCRKAGIKKYTCHQLRHFFATYTLERGGEGVIKAVSKMLGHASTSTTVDTYWDTDQKRVRKVHEEYAPFAQLVLPEGRGEAAEEEQE